MHVYEGTWNNGFDLEELFGTMVTVWNWLSPSFNTTQTNQSIYEDIISSTRFFSLVGWLDGWSVNHNFLKGRVLFSPWLLCNFAKRLKYEQTLKGTAHILLSYEAPFRSNLLKKNHWQVCGSGSSPIRCFFLDPDPVFKFLLVRIVKKYRKQFLIENSQIKNEKFS